VVGIGAAEAHPSRLGAIAMTGNGSERRFLGRRLSGDKQGV
jgi:hypothetical protein